MRQPIPLDMRVPCPAVGARRYGWLVEGEPGGGGGGNGGSRPRRLTRRQRIWAIVVGISVVLGILGVLLQIPQSLQSLGILPSDESEPSSPHGVERPPDVVVDLSASRLNPEGGSSSREYVCLFNAGGDPVQLAGWQLRDLQGHFEELGRFLLEPEAGVRVHTGPEEPRQLSSDDLFGESGSSIWNDDGDAVKLLDADERRVDEAPYGKPREGAVPKPCGRP
jgi:hypothetical protein